MKNINKYKKYIGNKKVLITGGPGSFGSEITKKLLLFDVKQIVILSHDEKEQFDMRNKYKDKRIKFIMGDVRDRERVNEAMDGVNLVFHAAALKQVPTCEFFPLEAVKTNVLGSANVMRAAIENNIERIVVLSTDKAVYPINAMGMTKALMEKTMIALTIESDSKTIMCGLRYGNVMYSRGSVLPYFMDLIKQNCPLTVTNKNMTRFLLSLDDSIDLALYALTRGRGGNIFVKKAPACTIGTLAEAMTSIFSHKKGIKEIGIRAGEKMHEVLITPEELKRTIDHGDYYEILPEFTNLNYEKYFTKGEKKSPIFQEGYTSKNTKRLSLSEVIKILKSIGEIKEEIAKIKK